MLVESEASLKDISSHIEGDPFTVLQIWLALQDNNQVGYTVVYEDT